MIKYFSFIGLLFLAVACSQSFDKKEQTDKGEKRNIFRLYSRDVADSFSVFVNLPNDYKADQKAGYPVVYLLDANL